MRAWITTEPIGAETVLPLVASEAHGAALVFLGVVRNHNEGRAVNGVYYEAYVQMAERTLEQILAEAAQSIEPISLAAVHRIGELAVGEVSLALAVSSPHRDEAFEACRYALEEIKTRLAVWKQERYSGGEKVWLEGTVPPVPERII